MEAKSNANVDKYFESPISLCFHLRKFKIAYIQMFMHSYAHDWT